MRAAYFEAFGKPQIGAMTEANKTAPLPMGWVMFNELERIGSHGMQARADDPRLALLPHGRNTTNRGSGDQLILKAPGIKW